MTHPHPIGAVEAVSGILDEYGRALGVRAHLQIPRGSMVRAHLRSGLWLHPLAVPVGIWPFPRPKVHRTILLTACGFHLPVGRQHAWRLERPEQWGHALQDADRQTIGLVRYNSIYLFFDLLALDPPLPRLLTRAVLDLSLRTGRLLPALTAAEREPALRLQDSTEDESLRSRAIWRSASDPDGIPALSAEKVRELEATLQTSARQMARLERRLTQADRRLAALERDPATPEALGAEVDRLAALPGIADVRIGESVVYLFTDLISVEYQGCRFRLGRFRIDLHFDGRVFLRNLTDRYRTYDHPHVEGGRPCLGNIRDWIRDLLAQREFAIAATVLLQYLHTVNQADWRQEVTCWPKVSSRGKT
jgi:hypothetical protein